MSKFKAALVMVALICTAALAVDEVTEPFVGVTHIHRTLTSPRPLNINIVRIDLEAEGISFKVTPSNGTAAGDTQVQKVTEFLEDTGAQIGINCGFFFWDENASGYEVMGYAASEGDIYSWFYEWPNWPTPYVSLNLNQNNKPNIIYPLPSFPIGKYVAPFGVTVYNAAPGSEWIVKNGVKNVSNWDINTAKHPRTAGGYTQDGKTLILVTIDGRQTGFSEGMYTSEVADLLISLGAYQGIAFDGGGSTTMAFADPTPRLVNVPINGGVKYVQRRTANNLAVYAQQKEIVYSKIVFNDFENSQEGTFSYSPGYSGSTLGILSGDSSAAPIQSDSYKGDFCERIFIKDDPTKSSVAEYPQGGWFVRWVSGSGARPDQNIARPATGKIGFWAKTSTPNLKASICLDNMNQMERGLPLDIVSDGYWHCYEWDVENDQQWEGWINGDGAITGSIFTIDSIQFFGPNTDATIYIDNISHDPADTLDFLENCQDVWKTGNGLVADLNKDCFVNLDDALLLAAYWLDDTSEYDISEISEGFVDFFDFAVLADAWLDCNDPLTESCQQ